MKIEGKIKEANDKALAILNETEDKSQAVVEAMNVIAEATYEDVINQIKEESEKVKTDKEFAKSLNLRTLSKEEKAFYNNFKDIKNAITAKQVDIIPTSIVDITLENIKQESGILSLVNFTPSDVKKWLMADKTGTYQWGRINNCNNRRIVSNI